MEKLQGIIDKEIMGFKESPENIAEYMKFAARFYLYSVKNQMLIKGQNSNSTFVASYAAWQKKGYQVEKGQSGIKIFVPTQIKICSLPGEFNGTKLYRDLSKSQKEKIDSGIGHVEKKNSFAIGNVFDISQTNCPPGDYPKIFTPGYDSSEHKEIFDAILDYTKQNNIKVDQVTTQEMQSISVQGYYSPIDNKSVIRSDIKDTAKLYTLIHELGHSEIHNLNRKDAASKIEAQREFEADGYTVMLLSELGLPITDDTKSHMHNAYTELLDHTEKVNQNIADKTGKKDLVIESMKVILDQFVEAKQTMIPHIKDYMDDLNAPIEYEPCPISFSKEDIVVAYGEGRFEM